MNDDNPAASATKTAPISSSISRDLTPGSPWRQLIERGLQDAHRHFEQQGASWRESRRLSYRIKKAGEGKQVRPYHFHDHVDPLHEETCDDRAKRMKRDRQRTYRGVTAETVRTYTDLSGLTDEERAERKRHKNNEAQRARRARLQAEKDAAGCAPTLNAEDLAALNAALDELDLDGCFS